MKTKTKQTVSLLSIKSSTVQVICIVCITPFQEHILFLKKLIPYFEMR